MRKIAIIIALISVLLIVTGCASQPTGAQSRQALQVYVESPEGNFGVRTAVLLAEKAGEITLVNRADQAKVIVINGQPGDAVQIATLVQQGAGLVLIPGPESTEDILSLLLGQDVAIERQDAAISLIAAEGVEDPILRDIVWGSAPQVRERIVVQNLQAVPIIAGFETQEIILGQTENGQGLVYLFTAYLDGVNTQYQEWPYFNYFIYDLTQRAARQTPATFGDYLASPVPHTRERLALVAICVALLSIAATVFTIVRRHSLAHPEALDNLVASKETYQARELGTGWEEVGFHRPLAGFLFALMMGVLLFIPLIVYQNMILPTFILPSAQAFGLIGRVGQAFGLAWTLFDVGTSVAFIKFYSQYRVHNPRRAIQYGQVFVWWQMLSGSIQVALVVILAGTLVPRTAYAVYTWIIIAHSIIQIPGFYRVMRDAMYAQQRLDYAQILDHFIMLVWPMITQPIFVLLLLWWGKQAPIFGRAMGGAFGLAIAAYFVEACNFVLGLFLYRRVGYSSRVLFMAHFDWSVIKEAFTFGVQDMGGSIVIAAAATAEIFLTQTRLVNYSEVWGNWMMANNFMLAFDVLRNLVDGVMPAISEAISHARRKLSQYYVTMCYKWNAMVGAFIVAVLLAIADRFILGSSGKEFSRAALYVLPLVFFGSVQHLNIIGDAVAHASNRPGMKMIMIAFEQAIRLTLALLLIARYQVTGLIIAYLVATLLRGVAIYFINSRVCFPLRYYAYQSLIAPLLAGGIHFVVLRFVTGLIWRGDPITSLIIFLIGILFSIPLYGFWYGLVGGFDDAGLEEFQRAVGMQPMLTWMSKLFYGATLRGSRLSPLHNRFPITIRAEALEEAASLTEERVSLTGS